MENSDLGDTTISLNYQPFKSGGDWPTTTIMMAIILPTGRSPYEINRDTDLRRVAACMASLWA